MERTRGGGGGGLFQSGLLCPCKLSFMYVWVCTPVNLCIIYYTFIFMICIHLYLLYSSVCVCMCVLAFVEWERATVDKQYVALPDTTWKKTLDLFGSWLLCPCKLNFMCVYVCVYTSHFMYNNLFIYFYDLYSPVSSFLMCVCVCVCVCVHFWNEREHPWTNSMCRFQIQPGIEQTRGAYFDLWHHRCRISWISFQVTDIWVSS